MDKIKVCYVKGCLNSQINEAGRLFLLYQTKLKEIRHCSLDFYGVARWDDIRTAYDLDKSSEEFRLLHKLKDSHLEPIRTQKMKVAKAAQALSHSVAATIMYAVRLGSLPSSASINLSR